MKNVRPRDLKRGANRRRNKMGNEVAKKDPNTICLTSLYSYLAYKDGQTHFNVLHCCAYSASNECLDVLLEFVSDEKINFKRDDGKVDSLKDLLVDRGYKQFTPFELAIARGNIESARRLLKAGGKH